MPLSIVKISSSLALITNSASASFIITIKTLKIGKLNKFYKTRGKLGAFLLQYKIYFKFNNNEFRCKSDQVLFIAIYL